MGIQQPKPLEVIELDIEGLYEETFLDPRMQLSEFDQMQQRAELQLITERRKAKMLKKPPRNPDHYHG